MRRLVGLEVKRGEQVGAMQAARTAAHSKVAISQNR
jgi:hypothetical protein